MRAASSPLFAAESDLPVLVPKGATAQRTHQRPLAVSRCNAHVTMFGHRHDRHTRGDSEGSCLEIVLAAVRKYPSGEVLSPPFHSVSGHAWHSTRRSHAHSASGTRRLVARPLTHPLSLPPCCFAHRRDGVALGRALLLLLFTLVLVRLLFCLISGRLREDPVLGSWPRVFLTATVLGL